MMYILPLFLLISCGIDHTVNVSKSKLQVEQKGPFVVDINNRLIEAATFCDNRYGYMSPEAEACFKDFRTYFHISNDLDKQLLTAMCTLQYTDIELVKACIEDVSDYYKEKTL